MKSIFSLFFITTLFFLSSCSNTCNCTIDTSNIYANDSTINQIDSMKIWELLNVSSSNHRSKFRLAILPSYKCERRTFTLVDTSNSPYIMVNYFNSPEKNQLINLESNQIEDFKQILNKNCFWTMKSNSETKTLDGVIWLLEANSPTPNLCTKRNKHVVFRKGSDSTFYEICDNLLKLANSSHNEQEKINNKCWTGE